MVMGHRKRRQKQQGLGMPTSSIVKPPGNAFYDGLNQILTEHRFDEKVETVCRKFYKKSPYGRPSLPPGVYFRLLLIGYFEGLDSDRGIAWRVADSLSLRRFLGYDLQDPTPDHSSLSKIRYRLDQETHGAVFKIVLLALRQAGLVKGQTIGVDATTLEANAAL